MKRRLELSLHGLMKSPRCLLLAGLLPSALRAYCARGASEVKGHNPPGGAGPPRESRSAACLGGSAGPGGRGPHALSAQDKLWPLWPPQSWWQQSADVQPEQVFGEVVPASCSLSSPGTLAPLPHATLPRTPNPSSQPWSLLWSHLRAE